MGKALNLGLADWKKTNASKHSSDIVCDSITRLGHVLRDGGRAGLFTAWCPGSREGEHRRAAG